MIGLFDPLFWILVGPPVLLGIIAQIWVRSAFARAAEIPARLSGAEAAREILAAAGLVGVSEPIGSEKTLGRRSGVGIERVGEFLGDHYDPRDKVVRLSPEVYGGRSLAALGIAAHEVGHALQDAQKYPALALRNAAVGIASFGSGAGVWILIFGLVFSVPALIWAGIILFSGVVLFQVLNLPVEFDASARAKAVLARMGLVDAASMRYVNAVLTAAALTYVAATLQSVMTLIYYVLLARNRE